MKIVTARIGRIELADTQSDLRFDYCMRVRDPLDWGPQHVDLATQEIVRSVYFGWPMVPDQELDNCCQALESGKEVLFWCEPILVSCLSILWLLETLASRT